MNVCVCEYVSVCVSVCVSMYVCEDVCVGGYQPESTEYSHPYISVSRTSDKDSWKMLKYICKRSGCYRYLFIS